MAIHRFTFQPQRSAPVPSNEPNPLIPQKLTQLPNVDKEVLTFEKINSQPEQVNEFTVRGFRVFDEAIKAWLTEMFLIPTKNGVKRADVRIAGGDKSYLIWRQKILDRLKGHNSEGRITLPAVSVNRTSASFLTELFSPPHHHMALRYTDESLRRVAKIYRPVPYLLEYEITWWTEFKRDAEYMLYELMPRFNPLAEIVVEDVQLRGNLVMRPGDWKDESDIESAAKSKDFRRYSYNFSAEAWLPLPEQIVPTVLGTISVIEEDPTGFIESIDNVYSFDDWSVTASNF